MTRHEMLKLYGKGRRRTPCRAFEIAILKWLHLPDHAHELIAAGASHGHWPHADNCAMCHHAGVGTDGLDCSESLCEIRGRGLCGEDTDIYERAVQALLHGDDASFNRHCSEMAKFLAIEYVKYLTKHKGLLK